jgi:hypothetical protein
VRLAFVTLDVVAIGGIGHITDAVRAVQGRLSGISVSHRKFILYGDLV